jgi:hypothetical protein
MKVIPIGKYRGRLFSDVAKSDPAYLNWMILNLTGELRIAADQALSQSSTAGAGGKAAGTRPPKRGKVVRAVRGSGEERSSRHRKQALR